MRLEAVADGVLVAVSRRLATTTTLVLGGPGPTGRAALLVDPAWEPDELEGLAREVRHLGADVVAGFATHAHHDHLLWHPTLGDVPRWATATTAATAGRERRRLLAEARLDAERFGGADHPPAVLALLGRVRGLARPEQIASPTAATCCPTSRWSSTAPTRPVTPRCGCRARACCWRATC